MRVVVVSCAVSSLWLACNVVKGSRLTLESVSSVQLLLVLTHNANIELFVSLPVSFGILLGLIRLNIEATE